MRNSLHFSTGNDECETPQDLYDELNAEFHFTRDVCATSENAKHKRFWTKEDNCLTKKWSGVCWMNPPYSRRTKTNPGLYAFVKKAWLEAVAGHATTVCLLAARTDTAWWHEFVQREVAPRPGVEVRFIRGRLKFSGAKDSAPFPSVIVVFHKRWSMKVYIATRLKNAAEHNRLMGMLAEKGIGVTYDWTTHGSVKNTSHERLQEVARNEVRGVVDADLVIVLLPGGRGTHVELGIALGLYKQIILVGDDGGISEKTCAFYHHPFAVNVRTLEQAVEIAMRINS